MSTFESLKYRNFRWIWLGQTTHALALWGQIIALPLLVLEITGNDPVQLGAVLAAWQGVQLTQMMFGLICAVGGISVFICLGDLRSFVTTRPDEPAAAGSKDASPAAGASGATSASPD
ncbi:MAG: hypothetical protein IH868_09500 [Chloroflexi bacterium]|nr:hypothetical protein [Chloroflexota bacterium]